MYPPHSFGGYELVWRSAMRHLERHGHEALVLTTDLRTASREPDDPNVRRELRWYWRDHGFPRLSRRERLRLERARLALETTGAPLTTIARRCGFGTVETMRRA
jgi:hypothetical protein